MTYLKGMVEKLKGGSTNQKAHYQLACLDLDAKMSSKSDWPNLETSKGWGKLNSLKTAANHPSGANEPEWWI